MQASETMSPTDVLYRVAEELGNLQRKATEPQKKAKLQFLASDLRKIAEKSRQQVVAGAHAYQLGKASCRTPGVENPIPCGSVHEKSLEPFVNDFINRLDTARNIIDNDILDSLVTTLVYCKWNLHHQAVSVSNSFKQGRRTGLYESGPFSRAEEQTLNHAHTALHLD